jgi:hypothetical protein
MKMCAGKRSLFGNKCQRTESGEKLRPRPSLSFRVRQLLNLECGGDLKLIASPLLEASVLEAVANVTFAATGTLLEGQSVSFAKIFCGLVTR